MIIDALTILIETHYFFALEKNTLAFSTLGAKNLRAIF